MSRAPNNAKGGALNAHPKNDASLRVGSGKGLGIAVEKWKRAERRYQRDCNIRCSLKRPDFKRRFLAKSASIAYQKLVRAIKNLARPNKADQPTRKSGE